MANNNSQQDMQRLPPVLKTLHTKFKAICAGADITMQEAAEEAIQDWVDKKEKEASKKTK